MVTGLPGTILENVQRVAGEVLSTECENATTQHLQVGEKVAKGPQDSRWSVMHLHAQVNNLSKKF